MEMRNVIAEFVKNICYFIYLFWSNENILYGYMDLVNDNNPDLGKLRFHLKLQRRHTRLLGSFLMKKMWKAGELNNSHLSLSHLISLEKQLLDIICDLISFGCFYKQGTLIN